MVHQRSGSDSVRHPAVARVSIATLRAIEDAIAPGLSPDEREARSESLRETIADLIDAARWRSEPL